MKCNLPLTIANLMATGLAGRLEARQTQRDVRRRYVPMSAALSQNSADESAVMGQRMHFVGSMTPRLLRHEMQGRVTATRRSGKSTSKRYTDPRS